MRNAAKDLLVAPGGHRYLSTTQSHWVLDNGDLSLKWRLGLGCIIGIFSFGGKHSLKAIRFCVASLNDARSQLGVPIWRGSGAEVIRCVK